MEILGKNRNSNHAAGDFQGDIKTVFSQANRNPSINQKERAYCLNYLQLNSRGTIQIRPHVTTFADALCTGAKSEIQIMADSST